MTDGTAKSAVDWSPAQYAKFRDERAQPFYDLLALVQPQPDMRVKMPDYTTRCIPLVWNYVRNWVSAFRSVKTRCR